jgi:hypothetical protein
VRKLKQVNKETATIKAKHRKASNKNDAANNFLKNVKVNRWRGGRHKCCPA